MEADKLIDLIRDIGSVSGRTEKMELLSEVVASELGRWVVEMAYDPFKTWGIKPPMPDKIEGGMNSVSFRRNLVEPLLTRLSIRELTGNAAQAEVFEVFQAFDNDGRDLLWRILSKDLKAGIGVSTIQQVAPGLIPTFAVMRAQAYEERFIKAWPQKGEFKLDGQRNSFVCKNGSGAFYTRSGKHVPALDFFVPNLLKVARDACGTGHVELSRLLLKDDKLNFMLDGEAMMGLFEETGALRRKDVDAKGAELHLYDIMSFDDFDAAGSVGQSLTERRELLSLFVRIAKKSLSETDTPDMIQMVPQYFLNSHEDVEVFFEQARAKTLANYLARGDAAREAQLLKTTIDKATGKPKVLEGIMVKNPDGLYDKKKSRGWLKLKPEETEDLRIIGAYPGKPGTKYEHTLGGVVVDRNGVRVRVSAFQDPERDPLWADFQADLLGSEGAVSPGSFEQDKDAMIYIGDRNENHLLIGRLIEIEFHEVTPDGSLRHPRFIRFRDDKDGEQSKDAA
ncbi:hypothetical protein PXK56_17910 [Phaeobacter gallaeciensis]|uniref:ATP-dependent DNA ligase n=1 Tax=Phaeobacter gallaeciensis TaxID=60890 RepID=UPI0023802B2A|nr:hypothetical protein [Phaeobacter gallaeciensis]MDE4297065.1 hypothetical protein [Phaeobacter gallaeciensis]